MIYSAIITGIFISRPNRFIAQVNINGEVHAAHVKNTGRCRELLISGVTVYLESHNESSRKTKYSLIAVQKGERLINMDSQAPNHILGEALTAQRITLPGFDSIGLIKREAVYGNSRLDFYVEGIGEKPRAYIEVKGVTLEEEGFALFPDAPTQRGIKHINELIHAASQGYAAYILFIIQMKGIRYFSPNDKTHSAFGVALREAAQKGVYVLAYDCYVTPGEIIIGEKVPVVL